MYEAALWFIKSDWAKFEVRRLRLMLDSMSSINEPLLTLFKEYDKGG